MPTSVVSTCNSTNRESWYGWMSPLMHCLVFPLAAASANDMTGLKESDEKLKQQQQESARRENILVMRLATKEQEMQECTVCI